MTISDHAIDALIQSNKELSESVRALSLAVHAVLSSVDDGEDETKEVDTYMDGTPVCED